MGGRWREEREGSDEGVCFFAERWGWIDNVGGEGVFLHLDFDTTTSQHHNTTTSSYHNTQHPTFNTTKHTLITD
jgi:hypothetical protein